MSYLNFDKNKLINLKYSLNRELLRSNRAGSYASTTIISSNTRKYHGLLVCPIPELDNKMHVLLSSLDETIIQRGKMFRMGLHKYPGDIYEPKGHRYIKDFTLDPTPSIIYRVGGVNLKKELVLSESDERILVKYTLLDAHSPTTIRLNPFLAFRSIHSLSKSNLDANTKCFEVKNGVKCKLYNGFPYLYMQISKKNEFVKVPHWYYNIEYIEEQYRGYDYQEDLFAPGFFEFSIKKGESVIFSAGTSEVPSHTLKSRYEKELKVRTPRDSYENNLINAAQQFIVKQKNRTTVLAGYHWFGRWGRDTFISLPGLCLSQNDTKTYRNILDSMISEMQGVFFPNYEKDYSSADTSLWFIWAVQKLAEYEKDDEKIWKKYGKLIKRILTAYKNGTDFNIKMDDNHLIYQGVKGKSLTWMDAIVNGKAVTPRIGYAVEINALWYNAICFALDIANKSSDEDFLSKWKDLAYKVKDSFIEHFWSSKHNYLADFVYSGTQNWDVRPNQIFAASMPYSPLSDDMKNSVIQKIESELLTPRGLRTLSPKNINYKGRYEGNQIDRDLAYHQGTAWPWLLGHFAEAYLSLHKKSGKAFIKKLYQGFEKEMGNQGVGTISEIYDGDPPHNAGGAISQAWSVAELLRIKTFLQ